MPWEQTAGGRAHRVLCDLTTTVVSKDRTDRRYAANRWQWRSMDLPVGGPVVRWRRYQAQITSPTPYGLVVRGSTTGSSPAAAAAQPRLSKSISSRWKRSFGEY